MVLEWDEGAHASRYAVQLSMDGRSFRDARQVTVGNGGTDWIALPESVARYVGIVVQGGPGQEIGRAHVCPPVIIAHFVCRLLLEKTTLHATLGCLTTQLCL